MDRDTVWQHVDGQRLEIADLIESIDARDPALWSTPSLCDGWTVGNVAAHLTHSTITMPRMLLEAARSGFRFNALVHRLAVRRMRVRPRRSLPTCAASSGRANILREPRSWNR